MTAVQSLRGNWNYPTAIRFGVGRIAELPDACREAGIAKPLLITDKGLAKLSIVTETLALLAAAGLPARLFADVRPNPTAADVEAGVAAYRAGGYDGVIAFGGGSGLDAAKAIALMVGQDRPIWDFEDRDDWWTRVKVESMAPVVAVPTTSGTGSEVGRASVITDESDHAKKIIFHPRMMPQIVIADPALTLDLPPKVTAAVGIDALSHNLEAYCSPFYHPIAQGVALEAISLVKQWLPVAVREGQNIEARSHMMVASTMGATAFQKGLGAMHSLSHPCGALLNSHHGLTIAIVMPYVLAFNRPAIDARMTALARYLDLPSPSFQAVLDWVLALRQEIGIPNRLDAIGVSRDMVPRLAKMAAQDPSCGGNPRKVNAEVLAQLYEDAIDGVLRAG
ncbi:MAG: iron-containing alcohol dehydrogenase [Roseiarcus sp.]|jgi:alcohol dehydrogenase class IV|uniref:iron-containing alcohol dehydrogenase n=1 Tax=Roseiarcus sp. TaxID=1969460 RepID=UPI003C1E541C